MQSGDIDPPIAVNLHIISMTSLSLVNSCTLPFRQQYVLTKQGHWQHSCAISIQYNLIQKDMPFMLALDREGEKKFSWLGLPRGLEDCEAVASLVRTCEVKATEVGAVTVTLLSHGTLYQRVSRPSLQCCLLLWALASFPTLPARFLPWLLYGPQSLVIC